MSTSNNIHLDDKEKTYSGVEFSHRASTFTRPSYLYVIPAIFMFFLVVFGMFPLTTQVHIQQVCNDLGEDDCDSSRVSAHASTLNLIAAFALSIPSILTCGIYGSIADVYGRKIVMIIPFVGLMFYALAYLYVDTFNPPSYVAIIIAGNFIMGLSGGYFTFIMSCMCYTSDATVLVPHTRKTVYSNTEATIFIPEVFGPVLTGLWATYFGFFVPLLLGVIISALAIVYVAFLPESLPPDAESRSQPLKLNPFQTFTSIMFLFTYKFTEPGDDAPLSGVSSSPVSTSEAVPERRTEQSPLPIMGVSFFVFLMAMLGQASVRIVYVTHRFGWNSSLIGIYDGMEGLVVSLSMLFAPLVVQRLMRFQSPVKLMTWIQVGYVFRILHWSLYGLMPNTAGIFCLLPLLLFVGPLPPYMRTVVSNSVPASQQAQIFAAFSALAGPLYSAAYTLLVQEGCPWVIFELLAAATAIALAIATYVRSVPHLAKHLPEVPHHGEELEGEGPVEHPLNDEEGSLREGLLGEERRISRASADGSRLVPADSTTLLYRHLAHNSVASAAEASSASVDGAGGAVKSNITSRLLSEQHNFNYED